MLKEGCSDPFRNVWYTQYDAKELCLFLPKERAGGCGLQGEGRICIWGNTFPAGGHLVSQEWPDWQHIRSSCQWTQVFIRQKNTCSLRSLWKPDRITQRQSLYQGMHHGVGGKVGRKLGKCSFKRWGWRSVSAVPSKFCHWHEGLEGLPLFPVSHQLVV